jgi:putative addiction module component (TIGR02574 family)
MPSQFESLTAAALKLTPDEREAFVQLLIDSLGLEADVDEVLAAEVERRNAEVESGKTHVIPIDEALALVRAG